MNIQIFGARKSFDTRKAERWFKERRIKYQYIDLDTKGLSAGEYRSVRAAVGGERAGFCENAGVCPHISAKFTNFSSDSS